MDILKRLETLEQRVEALEKKLASTPPAASNNNVKEAEADRLNISLHSYLRDENGKIKTHLKPGTKQTYICDDDRWLASSGIYLSTLDRVYTTHYAYFVWDLDKAYMILQELAAEKGHDFDFDLPDNLPEDKKEAEAFLTKISTTLVKTYGKAGKAFFNDHMLEINSSKIYTLSSPAKDFAEIISFISNKNLITREWKNEPFVDNAAWTDAERFKAIQKYVNSLVSKY